MFFDALYIIKYATRVHILIALYLVNYISSRNDFLNYQKFLKAALKELLWEQTWPKTVCSAKRAFLKMHLWIIILNILNIPEFSIYTILLFLSIFKPGQHTYIFLFSMILYDIYIYACLKELSKFGLNFIKKILIVDLVIQKLKNEPFFIFL